MTGRLRGKLLSITDPVTYEGDTIPELEAAFQRAVDAYEAAKSGTAA